MHNLPVSSFDISRYLPKSLSSFFFTVQPSKELVFLIQGMQKDVFSISDSDKR